MKTAKLIIVLLLATVYGVHAQSVDTLRFKMQRGKCWEIQTYGNNDSVKINGQMFYASMAGVETDPVWLSEKGDYLTTADASTTYQTIIPAGTYLTPSGDEFVYGEKSFRQDKLIVANLAEDGGTAFQSLAGAGGNQTVTYPNKSGTVALVEDLYRLTRYTAYSSGANNIEVLADSAGITATIVTNVITFTIPTGVKLSSVKVRITGYSNVAFHMGTADMGNSSVTDRWMPIVQSWREDTGQQLTGMTTTMDLTYFDKFVINGLISTTNNQIRINF